MKVLKKSRLAAVLAVTFALAVGACVLSGCGQSDEEVIRESLTEELDGIKNMDSEVVAELESGIASSGIEEIGIDVGEFTKAYLQGFDYTINSVTVDGDSAVANITLTCKSQDEFQDSFATAAGELAESGELDGMTEEEAFARLGEVAVECLNNVEASAGEPFDVTYELVDNTWTPTSDAELAVASAML